MERIKSLDRYQKGILILLSAMLVIFTVVYSVISSQVGFAYMGTILRPVDENGSTVYTGNIQRLQAIFTVTSDKAVTFRYGNMLYGPFTAREDPTAIPEEHSMSRYMTGVEILRGEEIFFRGGVYRSGEYMMLFEEDGSMYINGSIIASGGTVVDMDGNVIDQMEPSVSTILQLMEGPELTSKGEWTAWFLGLFVSIVTSVSMLFADELFRWNLAFQIRNVYHAEPSDWEIAGRYIGWTALTIMALVFYIMGLQ